MKILNFGSCNIDYVYSLDHIVKVGETETTYKMNIFPGGKGLNQSIAAAKGVGIELNSCDMNYSANEKEIILRPYMIAKRMGCKFYFGSDAHHPDELDAAKGIFERAIDDLKLEEGDGFALKRG